MTDQPLPTQYPDLWQLVYDHWRPDQQPLREALCALGNGYFVTRAAHPSCRANQHHYPGAYLAGVYNRLESTIRDRTIVNEDLVNFPNWLFLTFRPADSDEWFSPDRVEVLAYQQTLDLARGILRSDMRFRDRHGRETSLETQRLVHMQHQHLGAIHWKITPENWSGNLVIHSELDGAVTNSGVERYRQLNGDHLEPLATGLSGENIAWLEVRTRQSHVHLAQAMRTEAYFDEQRPPIRRETLEQPASIAQRLYLACREHHTLHVEKIVALYNSRDRAISEPTLAARRTAEFAPAFENLARSQHAAWQRLWRRYDITVEGDPRTQRLLRLHLFHLMQTVSINSLDHDVGIPPRGWHGEAYRGHIMWDELFIMPLLILRMPEVARSLFMYRYRRLDRARRLARQAGHRGAMFPWQSGSSGREESQILHLNPRSGRWVPDDTHLQRHVNAAIAYNLWHYYQATQDHEFLAFFAAEMILEIARLFDSLATWNPDSQRFDICGIVGPDEYHTRYPNAAEPGIHNNAYTNVLASWCLRRAADVLDILADHRRQELIEHLAIDREQIDRWNHVASRLDVPFLRNGLIAQFQGYDDLQELDWDRYRREHGENMRLDRILESQNDSVNNYKAGKQPDVLMLFYLFSAEELSDLFRHLDYHFDPATIPATIDYYRERTSHGSTLSQLVFSWVQARSDRHRSWTTYEKALVSDFQDVQGGTTPEGIHLGAMAGSVDMIQRCYTGLETTGDVLRLNPQLPEHIRRVKLRIRYRSHWVQLTVDHEILHVDVQEGWGNPINIAFRDQTHQFTRRQSRTFNL